MTVTLPPELAGLVAKAGGRWPQADEDQLHALAGSWRSLAGELRGMRDSGSTVARQVIAQHEGASIDAFANFWGEFERQLDTATTAVESAAVGVDSMAKAVLAAKQAIAEAAQSTFRHILELRRMAGMSGGIWGIIARGIAWLLARFGRFIWRILVWLGRWIWRGIVWLFKKAWAAIVAVFNWFKKLFKGKKQQPQKKSPPKTSQRDELLDELKKKGIKHNPEDVIQIGKDASGKVIFLEKGNARAGLEHILTRHADDFGRAGVPRDQIDDFVIQATTRGTQVGMQGTRPIYEVIYNGVRRRVAVSVGSNGFVVGANPV
jgi:hypothetical protein